MVPSYGYELTCRSPKFAGQFRGGRKGGMTVMIERLDISQKAEILGVLRQAFAAHPILPPGTPDKTTEAMLELMLDTFSVTEEAYLHGIRMEGTLACCSLSLDAHAEPKGPAVIRFFLRLFSILGWRLARDFVRAFSKRPKYEGRYLDLMLLGTTPDFQGHGLGRQMLRFLYGFAEEHGYKGVILGVAKDTPAYGFYCKEGFVVDSEVRIGSMPLCNMRREDVHQEDASEKS